MKSLKYCSFILLFVICSAYKDKPVPVLLKGAYGDCDCEEEVKSGSQNALFLNDDQSYSYNQLNRKNKIEKITGSWSMENGKIFLSNPENNLRIPDEWEIDKNGKCIKGRKGLSFIWLFHIESCKK